MEMVQVIPDAIRTLTGLAHQGYTPQTAVADLVDNSIAAKASKIDIRFSEQIDGSTIVSIADNGIGMTLETLKQAMQIGSSSNLANSSLSVYGMGMKTASMSFSSKFTVVTRCSDGVASEASWDLDQQIDNPWTISIGAASKSHQNMLNQFLGNESGTIVIWERADFKDAILDHRKIKGPKRKPSARNLESEVQDYLSMVFNRFMAGKVDDFEPVKISFNGEELQPWDPCSEEFLSDEWKPVTDEFSINISIDNKVVTVPYSMTTFLLIGKSDGHASLFEKSKVGMKTQGIYPYRDNRLLQSPDWLGIIVFHPDYNSMRVTLELDPRLDAVIRTDMKKSGLALPSEMWEDMRNKIEVYASNVRTASKERKRKTKAKLSTTDLHTQSNEKIIVGIPDIEQPIAVIQPDGSAKVSTIFGESITELPNAESLLAATDRRILSVEDLEGGVLFEPRLRGAELVICLNKSHPFYQKVYLGLYDIPLAIQGLDFLLYSLAHAELLTRTDRIKDQFRRMRTEMSEALRTFVLDLDDPDDDVDEALS